MWGNFGTVIICVFGTSRARACFEAKLKPIYRSFKKLMKSNLDMPSHAQQQVREKPMEGRHKINSEAAIDSIRSGTNIEALIRESRLRGGCDCRFHAEPVGCNGPLCCYSFEHHVGNHMGQRNRFRWWRIRI